MYPCLGQMELSSSAVSRRFNFFQTFDRQLFMILLSPQSRQLFQCVIAQDHHTPNKLRFTTNREELYKTSHCVSLYWVIVSKQYADQIESVGFDLASNLVNIDGGNICHWSTILSSVSDCCKC